LIKIGPSHIALILLAAFLSIKGHGQVPEDSTKAESHKFLSYGSKGFIFSDRSGNYLMNLEFRGQFRLSYPTDTDPLTLSDYQDEQLKLGIKRARLKVGGHSFIPWFKYYLEYELFSSNLLDFRLMYEKLPWLKIKVGQWKVQYNRERIISSGKQQTMERSILTRAFTVDRQQGVSVFGHLEGEGLANFNYWLSVFMGTGRGSTGNDDNHLMYMSRLQWNFMGESLKFSGTDLEFHDQFVGLLALGAVTNRSPYTRFSQSGGGQLEGFDPGAAGQYRVNQAMQESAGKYRGFSWQQEFHFKQIRDLVNGTVTDMAGNLIQAGYFFHHLWNAIPDNVEFYGRQAFYLPDLSVSDQLQNEFSFGFNWFIQGHRIKLTGEASHLRTDIASSESMGGWRYRFQLDVSF
jgi:hypothetical protein